MTIGARLCGWAACACRVVPVEERGPDPGQGAPLRGCGQRIGEPGVLYGTLLSKGTFLKPVARRGSLVKGRKALSP